VKMGVRKMDVVKMDLIMDLTYLADPMPRTGLLGRLGRPACVQ
jgi:hypothetical protein